LRAPELKYSLREDITSGYNGEKIYVEERETNFVKNLVSGKKQVKMLTKLSALIFPDGFNDFSCIRLYYLHSLYS
jgi:hypothetical protein